MVVDGEWGLDREYLHGDTIQVQCEPGYAVGETCLKSYMIECWEGEFRPTHESVPSDPQCEAVVCMDAAGAKNTCGEGSCPAFSSVFSSEESFLGVQLVTAQGRVSADGREVPHNGVVVVSCLESMSANPKGLLPQDYSDCPTIPPLDGAASFASGEYPAFCHDCAWSRQYYCATARCSLQEKPNPPNTVIEVSDDSSSSSSHLTYGGLLVATCERGYTFDQGMEGSIEIKCQRNCQFQQPPACLPKSCGTFSLPAGAWVQGWAVDREYFHGETFSVTCLASHRVPPVQLTDRDCTASYEVQCDNGHLVRVSNSEAGFQHCEFVECLDGGPCSVCQAYSPQMGDLNVATWEPISQIMYGQVVNVRCKEGYRAAQVDMQDSTFYNVNCSKSTDISIAVAASTATCDNGNGYQAACTSSGWQASRRCVPIVCKISYTEVTQVLEHPERVESITYGTTFEQVVDHDFVDASDHVRLHDVIKVTCREGYRPGSHDRNQPRWQLLTCQSTCGFTPLQPCLPVVCDRQEVPGNSSALSPRIEDGAAVPVMYDDESFTLRHLDSVSFVCNRGYALDPYLPSSSSWRDATSFRNNTLEWTPCKTVSTVTCWDGMLRGQQACTPLSRFSHCKTCAYESAFEVVLASEVARLPPVTQMYIPGIEFNMSSARASIIGLEKQAAESGLVVGDVVVSVDGDQLDQREDVLERLQTSHRGESVVLGVARPSTGREHLFLVIFDVAVKIIPPIPPASVLHSVVKDGVLPYDEPYHSGDAVVVDCDPGYHAQSQNESEASCSAPTNYSMVCSEASFRSSGPHGLRCTPHRCQLFMDWSLDNHVESAVPPAAMLGDLVNVSCQPGFRPMPANTSRLLTAQDPSWFLARCLQDCTYDAPQACHPITCPRCLEPARGCARASDACVRVRVSAGGCRCE